LFPSTSQTIPIKFLLFPSITHQNYFVPIKFPNNSHQIPLVPISNPSNSFCSHQLPINSLLFPTLKPHKALNCVRDWGRVLNGATRFLGRPEEELQWQADVCRLPRFSAFQGFVEDYGQICFSRGSRPRFFLHVRGLEMETW